MTLESVELFAGAGGLALGFSEHNVSHRAIVEWNKHACSTIRTSKRANVEPICHWPDVTEVDIREFSYDNLKRLDLVTGGPPCQPFSAGGKHRGFLDTRDMFPQAIRAVREVQPRSFVFENVRGLTRAAFKDYFEYIQLQLQFPSLSPKIDEEWFDHFVRLALHKKQGGRIEYRIDVKLVNAANYGVPQKRMRVFLVGFREGVDGVRGEWNFPKATHSHDALLYSQWGVGDYWDLHKVARKDRPQRPDSIEKKINMLSDADPTTIGLPWQTVRDAFVGLPDPEKRPNDKRFQAHKFQPGARSYPGHTGSPLDEPAKALKAGDHGVPGGENMLRRPDGSVRYFTVRESARIQTFDDSIIFDGSWGETMRQLGNAVPVRLAAAVAGEVCAILRADSVGNLKTGT